MFSLQRSRELLTMVFVVMLPFHALIVTVGTKLAVGQNQAPLTMIALWKEGLLALILLIALLEFAWPAQDLRSTEEDSDLPNLLRIDAIDVLLLALLILSFLLAYGLHTPVQRYLIGFRYDFVPLIAFAVLRRVPWSDVFRRHLLFALAVTGTVIASYGVLTLVLPDAFFRLLGYSDLHSLYLPHAPLAAFQYIEGGGFPRMQSVMSGPNQLGLWLLIPWSILLASLFHTKGFRFSFVCFSLTSLLIGLAMLFTFSRSAWIAAAVIATVVLLKRGTLRRYLPWFLGIAGVGLMVMMVFLPAVLERSESTSEHARRPIIALQTIARWPLGRGIGTVGPASNALSDACVFLKGNDDPSWARDRTDLCVFLGEKQVQPDPALKACRCPFLPENWYLQMGVELGVVGLLLYLALIGFTLRALSKFPISNFQFSIFLAFLGVAIAALFLHAWEDSAVAYTVWILVAIVLGSGRRSSLPFHRST